VTLTGQLSSLAPRTVFVRQGDRELGRFPIGKKAVPCSVTVALDLTGRGTIEFSTDTPGVREGPNADARALAFALYDPRLTPASP
jgi:hypothetical protein